jgi:hypothetical protein
MNPIQDFNDALKEFRQISFEIIPDRKRYGSRGYGNVKKFSNLDEFHEYHRIYYTYKSGSCRSTYKKKTDRVYKKREGITSKITVDRKENPREWDNQYHWFCRHPEEDVYDPDHSRPHLNNVKRPGRKPSEISKKITVNRSKDAKEYTRQYMWFKKHPEAEHCPPKKLKD